MSDTEDVHGTEASEGSKLSIAAGTASDRERARLEQLSGALRLLYEDAVQVDYRQAERDAEVLAARLLEELPRSELQGFLFRGIPRGGAIVLGMLSYVLDLSVEQLDLSSVSAESGVTPEVWVDDCSLTGARFAQQKRLWPASEIVFAHLYSPEPLRAEIVRRETGVRLCLAARDLELLDSREEVEARRDSPLHRAVPGERYWLGRAQRVCFAWSEPDLPFWNHTTENLEDGWRFAPPHRCLKSRSRLREGLALPTGFKLPERSSWRCPEGVAWGEFEGVFWLCRVSSGEVISLEGTAAQMWGGLVAWGSRSATMAVLGRACEVESEALARDLDDFAGELLARGFLERIDEPG